MAETFESDRRLLEKTRKTFAQKLSNHIPLRCATCQDFKALLTSSNAETIGDNLKNFLEYFSNGLKMKNPLTGRLDACSSFEEVDIRAELITNCMYPRFVDLLDYACNELKITKEDERLGNSRRRFVQEALRSGTLELNNCRHLLSFFRYLLTQVPTGCSYKVDEILEDLVTIGSYNLRSQAACKDGRKDQSMNLLGFLVVCDLEETKFQEVRRDLIKKIHQFDPGLLNSCVITKTEDEQRSQHTPLGLCATIIEINGHRQLDVARLLLELGADPNVSPQEGNENAPAPITLVMVKGDLEPSVAKMVDQLAELFFSKMIEKWKGKEKEFLEFMKAQWSHSQLGVPGLTLLPDSQGDYQQRTHAAWPYALCADQDFRCPALIYSCLYFHPSPSERLKYDKYPLLFPFRKKWELMLTMFDRINFRLALLSNSRLLDFLLDVDSDLETVMGALGIIASSTTIAHLVSPHSVSCGDLLREATKDLYPDLLGPVHKCFQAEVLSEALVKDYPMAKVLTRLQQPLKHFKPGKALSEAYVSFLASDAAKSVPSPENSFATFLATVYSAKNPTTVAQHIAIMVSFDSLMVAEISSPSARKDTMLRWLMFCESILVGFCAEDMLSKVAELKTLPVVSEFRSGLTKVVFLRSMSERVFLASTEDRELHSFLGRLCFDYPVMPLSLLWSSFDRPKSVECRLAQAVANRYSDSKNTSASSLAKALSSLVVTGKIEAAREFCNSDAEELKGKYQDAMKQFLRDRGLLNGPLRLYKPKKKIN